MERILPLAQELISDRQEVLGSSPYPLAVNPEAGDIMPEPVAVENFVGELWAMVNAAVSE